MQEEQPNYHDPNQERKNRKKPIKKGYLVLILFFWLCFFLGTGGAYLLIEAADNNWLGYFGPQPSLQKLQNPKNELASIVYTADNKELGKYFRENRTNCRLHEISPNVVQALYATEDIRFKEHPGIDIKGIFAIPYYLLKGEKRGSSTVTQQLAKNLFNTRGESYEGKFHKMGPMVGLVVDKIKEWVVAVKLERNYTKKEILELYFNTVTFGSNTFGIHTAAKTFFNKKPSKLQVQEAAVLVGLLKAPTRFSPVYNPEESKERRNIVMHQMTKYGYLSQAAYDTLKDKPLDLEYNVESHTQGNATYFRNVLRDFLLKWQANHDYDIYADGLRIYTTIDSRMQRMAENAVDRHMSKLQGIFDKHWKGRDPFKGHHDRIHNNAKNTDIYRRYLGHFQDSAKAWEAMKKADSTTVFTWEGEKDTVMSPLDSIYHHLRFLHCGMVSIDPHTGEIKAWVGGINYKYFQFDHVQQGRRQPGSTFKPILYTAAMENGYSPCNKVVDAPVTFTIDRGPDEPPKKWKPKNATGRWTHDRMTLRKALARSKNSISAYLISKIGPKKVVECARRLGIKSYLDPVPPLALGTSDVTVKELTSAYCTFANMGQYVSPLFVTRIEDKYGNVIERFMPEKRMAISEETAYTMIHMLRGTTLERGGTALGLYGLGQTLNHNEVAAKTGTTQGHSDGWFMGTTKDLVTGIWVGGDQRFVHFRSLHWGQGARMAMPIWSYYMDSVYAHPETGVRKGSFPIPDGYDLSKLDCSQFEEEEKNDTTQTQDSTHYQAPKKEDLEF